MMNKDQALVLQRIRARIKPENRIFVDKNFSISKQVAEILEKKGWTQKEFARQLGKQESEVSKLMSGLHNLTLQSIAKMEAVLGEEIIVTPMEACQKYRKIEYVTLRIYARTNTQNQTSNLEFSSDASFGKDSKGKIRVA
jgi:transcriptional regulator with XRE-family HTH domain